MNWKEFFRLMKLKISITLILMVLYLLFIPINSTAQDNIIPPKDLPEERITPLNPHCDIRISEVGYNMYKGIDARKACYKKFLNEGMDESSCKAPEGEDGQVVTGDAIDIGIQSCYYGFGLAKEDYTICDNIEKTDKKIRCYSDTAIASSNPKICKLLYGKDKESCFTLYGPSTNLTWILWFIGGILVYILISLAAFIISIVSIKKSNFGRDIIIFSLSIAILLFVITLFLLVKPPSTDVLSMAMLVPFISLFLSALIMKGWDFLIKTRKWIILLYNIVFGFLHGSLIPIIAYLIAVGFRVDMSIIGIYFLSIIYGCSLAVLYLLFYSWIIKKIKFKK